MTRVMIAAGTRITAEAGTAIAEQRGNAVDAAIAAAIVSMCTDTGIMSPGGGAFITVWPQTGEPAVIDGYAEMPGRGLEARRLGESTHHVTFDYGGERPISESATAPSRRRGHSPGWRSPRDGSDECPGSVCWSRRSIGSIGGFR